MHPLTDKSTIKQRDSVHRLTKVPVWKVSMTEGVPCELVLRWLTKVPVWKVSMTQKRGCHDYPRVDLGACLEGVYDMNVCLRIVDLGACLEGIYDN